MSTEAMKLALAALENRNGHWGSSARELKERAITALQKALEQPQQEPVAGMDEMVNRFLAWPLPESVCTDPCTSWPGYSHSRFGTSLLTAVEARQMLEYVLQDTSPPAQRKPLTDADLGMYISKELAEYINGAYADIGCAKDQLTYFARTIEAAHGIKGDA